MRGPWGRGLRWEDVTGLGYGERGHRVWLRPRLSELSARSERALGFHCT